MSPDCDDCERVPLNEIPTKDLIGELSEWASQLTECNIDALEEITREWRETH